VLTFTTKIACRFANKSKSSAPGFQIKSTFQVQCSTQSSQRTFCLISLLSLIKCPEAAELKQKPGQMPKLGREKDCVMIKMKSLSCVETMVYMFSRWWMSCPWGLRRNKTKRWQVSKSEVEFCTVLLISESFILPLTKRSCSQRLFGGGCFWTRWLWWAVGDNSSSGQHRVTKISVFPTTTLQNLGREYLKQRSCQFQFISN